MEVSEMGRLRVVMGSIIDDGAWSDEIDDSEYNTRVNDMRGKG